MIWHNIKADLTQALAEKARLDQAVVNANTHINANAHINIYNKNNDNNDNNNNNNNDNSNGNNHNSGGPLCTLIGVPSRGVSFSTPSTGRFVLKQYSCKGAESAEHAETAGYTYEGTPTTV